MDLPRVYKVEGAAQGLDHGFFDGPEQGRGPGQISTRQPQGMVQLRSMEDPVYGVFSLEFSGCGHIDADIRPIPTEGGPDFSTPLATGDGRAPIFTQPELGPAQLVVDHLDRDRGAVGGLTALPQRTFLVPSVPPGASTGWKLSAAALRPHSSGNLGGFGGNWQGGIEDRSPALQEIHGLDSYFLASLCHSHLSFPVRLSPKPSAAAYPELA